MHCLTFELCFCAYLEHFVKFVFRNWSYQLQKNRHFCNFDIFFFQYFIFEQIRWKKVEDDTFRVVICLQLFCINILSKSRICKIKLMPCFLKCFNHTSQIFRENCFFVFFKNFPNFTKNRMFFNFLFVGFEVEQTSRLDIEHIQNEKNTWKHYL